MYNAHVHLKGIYVYTIVHSSEPQVYMYTVLVCMLTKYGFVSKMDIQSQVLCTHIHVQLMCTHSIHMHMQH